MMYLLTEGLEIIPADVYDTNMHGCVLSEHETFDEAKEAENKAYDNAMRDEIFYNQY